MKKFCGSNFVVSEARIGRILWRQPSFALLKLECLVHPGSGGVQFLLQVELRMISVE